MMSQKTFQLGLPHDRRKGKRIVTVRNFWATMLIAVLAFAVISIASERRPGRPGDFGRLYASRMLPSTQMGPRPVVIAEQIVLEQTVAEARFNRTPSGDGYLFVSLPLATTSVAMDPEDSTSFQPAVPPVTTAEGSERFMLTGGPERVRLAVSKTE